MDSASRASATIFSATSISLSVGAPGDDLERVAVAVAAREVHRPRRSARGLVRRIASTIETRSKNSRQSSASSSRMLVIELAIETWLAACSCCASAAAVSSTMPSAERRRSSQALTASPPRLQLAEPLREPHEERRRDVLRSRRRSTRAAPAGSSESSCAASTRRSAQRSAAFSARIDSDDRAREPAQVLDERDAQHDRDRPHLADGERRDLLVAVDEAEQVLLVDARVGVGDERRAAPRRCAGSRPTRRRRAAAARCRSRAAGPPGRAGPAPR